MSTSCAPPTRRRRGRVETYTRDQMLATLRELAGSDNTLSKNEFLQHRAHGDASPALYERRFGSWNKALAAAGLNIVEQPMQLQDMTQKWTDDALWDILRVFHSTGGHTTREFHAWQQEHSLAKRHAPAPTLATVRFRLGRWSQIVATICNCP